MAAALAVKTGVDFDEVNINELQKELVAQGARIN
ncbi:FAD-dependent oxidoreductase [bacterium]|nr:FAD-dependent oxidoreductase [bacterium]